jgi:hypothetical protein
MENIKRLCVYWCVPLCGVWVWAVFDLNPRSKKEQVLPFDLKYLAIDCFFLLENIQGFSISEFFACFYV